MRQESIDGLAYVILLKINCWLIEYKILGGGEPHDANIFLQSHHKNNTEKWVHIGEPDEIRDTEVQGDGAD